MSLTSSDGSVTCSCVIFSIYNIFSEYMYGSKVTEYRLLRSCHAMLQDGDMLGNTSALFVTRSRLGNSDLIKRASEAPLLVFLQAILALVGRPGKSIFKSSRSGRSPPARIRAPPGQRLVSRQTR